MGEDLEEDLEEDSSTYHLRVLKIHTILTGFDKENAEGCIFGQTSGDCWASGTCAADDEVIFFYEGHIVRQIDFQGRNWGGTVRYSPSRLGNKTSATLEHYGEARKPESPGTPHVPHSFLVQDWGNWMLRCESR